MVQTYKICGLTVASEIALPALTAAPLVDTADIRIHEASVPEALATPSRSGPIWQLASDHFLLIIPGLARFLISNGRTIRFERLGNTANDSVAAFLTGTVLGILLHLRQHLLLSGSAVRVHDRAVIFCGPSGTGKSTLAAALTQRGYPLVADEFCCISTQGKQIIQADGQKLKLWAQAIDHLQVAAGRDMPVRSGMRKYLVDPLHQFDGPLPIGAIYILREARRPQDANVERPNAVDATLQLYTNAYRPLLVDQMGQVPQYLRAAVDIASAGGIFFLTRVLDFSGMVDVIATLEQHWRDRAQGDSAL